MFVQPTTGQTNYYPGKNLPLTLISKLTKLNFAALYLVELYLAELNSAEKYHLSLHILCTYC